MTKTRLIATSIAMKAVGLKTLKNKLSEYVRLTSNGETVLVTDRGTVVAKLVPPQPGRSRDVADAFLGDAVRKGWATPTALHQGGPAVGLLLGGASCRAAGRAGGSVIYPDTWVALAQPLSEDRIPPRQLWDEPLVCSRLLVHELRA